jgi:hypothetical protein
LTIVVFELARVWPRLVVALHSGLEHRPILCASARSASNEGYEQQEKKN